MPHCGCQWIIWERCAASMHWILRHCACFYELSGFVLVPIRGRSDPALLTCSSRAAHVPFTGSHVSSRASRRPSPRSAVDPATVMGGYGTPMRFARSAPQRRLDNLMSRRCRQDPATPGARARGTRGRMESCRG